MAQMQSKSAGFFLQTAIHPSKAVLTKTWQVFLCNTDPRITDAQGSWLLQIDAHAACKGILDGIGEQLLHHKAQPLFVRHQPQVGGFHFHSQLLLNKVARKAFHR